MKKEADATGGIGRFINAIGFILLGVCFLYSLVRVLSTRLGETSDGRIVVRFAHPQLESGLREAFDVIAGHYEAEQRRRGKEVDIIQMPIPERIYGSWIKTQLIGGTAPEIIMTKGGGDSVTESMIARYFYALGGELEEPNEYNAGTSLEGVPWRETFIGQLERDSAGYRNRLQEFYGIPYSMRTTRIFYNRTLLEKVLEAGEHSELRLRLGEPIRPKNYVDFVALCEAVRNFADLSGEALVPIAGSKYNAPFILERLFESQSQAVVPAIDVYNELLHTVIYIRTGFLKRKWTLRDKPIRDGFQMMREVGRYMQPGFSQLGRQDATFRFAQERAAMIATTSADAPSFRAQIEGRFEIGAFPVPLPSPSHPRYGPNTKGSITEAETSPYGPFGIVNFHPVESRETAIDFLRFLTSMKMSEIFVERTGWLPAIEGIDLPEHVKPFQPVMDGYPAGFKFTQMGGAELQGIIKSNLYRLWREDGSVDEFLDVIEDDLYPALVRDLRKANKEVTESVRRQDSLVGANFWLSLYGDAKERDGAKHRQSMMMSMQQVNYLGVYRRKAVFREIGIGE